MSSLYLRFILFVYVLIKINTTRGSCTPDPLEITLIQWASQKRNPTILQCFLATARHYSVLFIAYYVFGRKKRIILAKASVLNIMQPCLVGHFYTPKLPFGR